MSHRIVIAGRQIGAGCPPFLIAEIAQAHDGSLGTAHALLAAAADAGADAVKFQTHIAAAESTPGEPFRVPFSRQDADRYAYWQRMEFTPEQWRGLAEHARELGVLFLSTPFSDAACDLLESLDVAAWKVGSGEVTNLPMVRRMATTGKPVLLSSGMATWEEMDAAVAACRQAGAPFAVFQCTTAYPTPAAQVGLNLLAELRQRYACPVGLSDHSGAIYAGLAAAALGADLLEVHITFHRQAFGPDVSSSVTLEELRQLVEGTRFIHDALSHPVDKDKAAESMTELRRIFGKSIVASHDLVAGHILERRDLVTKKPGGGLPPARLESLVGRRLCRPVKADQPLKEQDFAVLDPDR
jgi:N,N'-diacetyllegionaminate synthase